MWCIQRVLPNLTAVSAISILKQDHHYGFESFHRLSDKTLTETIMSLFMQTANGNFFFPQTFIGTFCLFVEFLPSFTTVLQYNVTHLPCCLWNFHCKFL